MVDAASSLKLEDANFPGESYSEGATRRASEETPISLPDIVITSPHIMRIAEQIETGFVTLLLIPDIDCCTVRNLRVGRASLLTFHFQSSAPGNDSARCLQNYYQNVYSSIRRSRAHVPEYVKRILLGKPDELPRVSAALSGGGLRASVVGAGILNALDGRNETRFTSLGAPVTSTSMAQANFPGIYGLTLGSVSDDTDGWLTEMNFVAPAGLDRILQNPIGLNAKWWMALGSQVSQKALAGFDVSLGDISSRILAYHFVNGTTRENFFDSRGDHGVGASLSDLRNLDTIQSYSQPFPIITSVPESPGRLNDPAGECDTTQQNQYEFNMYESGSWDPSLASFIDTAYLGSSLRNGHLLRRKDAMMRPRPSSAQRLSLVFTSIQGGLGTDEYLDRESQTLRLMDGSFGGENIPFAPLLVPDRQVDVIVAFDASDDGNGWAGGKALKATSSRSNLMPDNAYPFPGIPETLSRINFTHPTFFGCLTIARLVTS
ncbi:hypothetical protein H4Q26_006413 [Puccinia striiformis f. sp. tritici PST-130]|nr:hypothetical protein H4Q26_006413 [Puccinia striiformis f. sp. tritici PST-130]